MSDLTIIYPKPQEAEKVIEPFDRATVVLENSNLCRDVANVIVDYTKPLKQYILYGEQGSYSDYRKDIRGVFNSFEQGLIALLSCYRAGLCNPLDVYDPGTNNWTFAQHGDCYQEDSHYTLLETRLNCLDDTSGEHFSVAYGIIDSSCRELDPQPEIFVEWKKQLIEKTGYVFDKRPEPKAQREEKEEEYLSETSIDSSRRRRRSRSMSE